MKLKILRDDPSAQVDYEVRVRLVWERGSHLAASVAIGPSATDDRKLDGAPTEKDGVVRDSHDEAAARQAAYEAKLAAREEHEARTGKAMTGRTGRKPKPPEARQKDVQRSKKANITDPDSRTMSSANCGYLQGYNAQAVVTEAQITIACAVTNDATDFAQLQPIAEQAADNLKAAGVKAPMGTLLADAGYCTDGNLGLEGDLGVELLIATRQECNRPRGRIPKGLTGPRA